MALLTGLTSKMNKKIHGKSIFESGFDSFELDDGFLLKLDADVAKNSVYKKDFKNTDKENFEGLKILNQKKQENDKFENNSKQYDFSLHIEDFNDSDFFDLNKTTKLPSNEKVDQSHVNETEKKSCSNVPKSCLSPILVSKSALKANISASTPLKTSDESSLIGKVESNQKEADDVPKSSEFDFLEADLFEEWNLEEIKKPDTQKDTLTLSQALQMIEEESAQTKELNKSVDLLTGEIISADVKSLFAQSFDKLQSVEKPHKNEEKIPSEGSVTVLDDFNTRGKPPAAQKLNFDCENKNEKEEKENVIGNICFSSDDDFNFCTQDLLDEAKKKSDEGVSNFPSENTGSQRLAKCDSVEDILSFKRRKNYNIVESDTTDDSPSPKYQRQKRTRKQRNAEDNSGREFVDFEAEVSEESKVSSDEFEEEGDYDKSFVDEEPYFTQNQSADMMAKYLESVKSVSNSGTFKIPAMKPYDPEEIFSQVPEDNNTDYLIDSFCVNDVGEDVKTDLSELEIAEKILEMDKNEKRRKRSHKSRKVK